MSPLKAFQAHLFRAGCAAHVPFQKIGHQRLLISGFTDLTEKQFKRLKQEEEWAMRRRGITRVFSNVCQGAKLVCQQQVRCLLTD